ncbi:MAG: T9SS type A sorting domain-containing protein [Chitinophagaceae bacterium]|nr:MAG: T9SS type A sorting domain-containing protein [Chitinophagaceae bacterium]
MTDRNQRRKNARKPTQMKKIFIPIILILFATTRVVAQVAIKLTAGSQVSVTGNSLLFVAGGFSLDNNSTLKNDGTVVIAKAAGTADFTDESTTPYSYGTGSFEFSATGIQAVKSANTFGSILVNNSGFNLSSDISSTRWLLTNGKVLTGNFIATVTSTLSNAMDADAGNPGFIHSWIQGNLRRYISPATVNSYRFPVGSASHVFAADLEELMSNPLTGVSYITASFGPKPGSDAGLNAVETATSFASVNNAGVWHLVPDANPAAGRFDLKLATTSLDGLTDNSFAILRRADASAVASDWTVPAGTLLPAAGQPGRTVSGGFARRNRMTTFGQMGIGVALTALPLELLGFHAQKLPSSVKLDWTTASEQNTDRFEILRSDQASGMASIGSVSASGFSNTDRSYQFTDASPLQGLNYYQLKMIDKDGRFTLSNTVKVEFKKEYELTLFPNPVTGQSFFIDHGNLTVKNVQLTSIDGKHIQASYQPVSPTRISVVLPAGLAKGTFIVRMEGDGQTITKLISVQ